MNINRENLAWAAGFYEGEGTIGYYNGLALKIPQVNKEPLDKFLAIAGVGRIIGPYTRNPKHKPQYVYQVFSFEHCQALIAMLWPWLSESRKLQIKRAFIKYHNRRSNSVTTPQVAA
jgi:hypothetical protein